MEKRETELEKCLYNDVCINYVCLYSRPTRRSSVMYVLLMAIAFVNNFYPRDAMRKRGLCCRKMAVCLSV